MKQRTKPLLLTLLALGCLNSCATQNSPLQTAIAQRIQNSMVLGPAAGLVAGGAAAVKSPFEEFFGRPLASTAAQGGAQ